VAGNCKAVARDVIMYAVGNLDAWSGKWTPCPGVAILFPVKSVICEEFAGTEEDEVRGRVFRSEASAVDHLNIVRSKYLT
jgi:hypothetical protein